ncbi:MAG TPA: DUF4333 domain-containing protein [Acidimicrobiales bacterium]|nr:DUF4333 domain-containing protein [Acidimicrobiales bacterium]
MTTAAGRRRGRWVPGIIALAALLAIGIVVGAGADLTHPSPRTLTGRDVASQLALAIQADKGLTQPPRLKCPASEPVRAGLTFQCTATGVQRGPAEVVVTEIDGRGHLRWSLSSP